jgi:hypothetical protein
MIEKGKSIEEVCQKLSITPTQIENAQLKRNASNKEVSGRGFEILKQLRDVINPVNGVGQQDCIEIMQSRITGLQASLDKMTINNERLNATILSKNKEIEELRNIKLQYDALCEMLIRKQSLS